MSGHGCEYSGSPGRGDCENFIGLPGESIPGQHDGDDDTVDHYGKPNGWCWYCWKSYQLNRAINERDEALDALEALCNDIVYRRSGGYPELHVERELLGRYGR